VLTHDDGAIYSDRRLKTLAGAGLALRVLAMGFELGANAMRLFSIARTCALGGVFFTFTSIASAAIPGSWQVRPAMYGTPSDPQEGVTPANDPYTAYSGVGNAGTGQLYLIENTAAPAPADDRVTFDGITEAINNYVTTPAPTPRTVTESDVSLGGNLRKLSIAVNTTVGFDLWPQGFVDGTTQAPLLAGGMGVGFTLPPAINGGPANSGEVLGWNGDLITQADIDITDTSGTGNTGPLPLNVFFNSTTNWNGIFGVIFTDPSSPTGVTGFGVTMIRLNITYLIPEPTSLAALAPIGLLAVRRRRK
jgi:hypothetical protein